MKLFDSGTSQQASIVVPSVDLYQRQRLWHTVHTLEDNSISVRDEDVQTKTKGLANI